MCQSAEMMGQYHVFMATFRVYKLHGTFIGLKGCITSWCLHEIALELDWGFHQQN